jgi:hypothetical protein
MMCGGGGDKGGRKRAGRDVSSTMRIVALIDHGGHVILRPPYGLTPGNKACKNQLIYYARGISR